MMDDDGKQWTTMDNDGCKTTLKEAFTNLAAMQKQEKRKLSMNIDRLMDL